jgi:hypothetical protein
VSTVYTADGRAVRVITNLPDGRKVVEHAVEDGDDDLYFTGQTEIVGRVFDDPPREAFHKDILKLEERQKQLRDQIHVMSTQIADAERAHTQRMTKLQKYEQLQLVEDFLDGKITHYVIVRDSYYSDGTQIQISTPQAEVCGDERPSYQNKLKLLALYGNQNDRTLEWLLHYYSDGSGSSRQLVYPFTSLEAAQAKATALMVKAFDVVRKKPQFADYAIASARALNMAVPADILEIQQTKQMKSLQSYVDEARKKLAEAEKALAAAQGAQS